MDTIYGVCYEPPTDIFGVIWVAMLVTALVLSPLFLKSTSVAILVIASIGDLFTPTRIWEILFPRSFTPMACSHTALMPLSWQRYSYITLLTFC